MSGNGTGKETGEPGKQVRQEPETSSGLAATLPENEPLRMDVLRRYDILDSGRDERFDRVARIASLGLGVPIAFVTFVDADRVWFKSSIGVELDQCDREGSFCGRAILDDQPLVVPNTTEDPRFMNNPFVVGEAGIRFYAGAPLRTPDGFNLGTICVFDVQPRELDDEKLEFMMELSSLVVQELEQHRRAQAALDATAERLQDVTSNVPGLVYQFRIDAQGKRSFPYLSPILEEFFGLSVAAVVQDHEVWFNLVHREDVDSLETAIANSQKTLAPLLWEGRIFGVQREPRWYRVSATPRRLEGGAVLWTGIMLDVNEEKAAAHRLKQMHKLEAVGQLTGGVAHDFNNLLAVIQSNAEMLGDQIDQGENLLHAILRSAGRGAELTERLLSFSRRQSLSPVAVDLSATMREMSGLLQRTLGETIDVKVAPAEDLWPALADPGQVENAILNLAINARDAMEGGGRLSISCCNRSLAAADLAEGSAAEPGDFVLLSVTDDGSGMSPGVLEQALEPYFTTKEVGLGSGLGLSMVYGFAEQSGGQLTIVSKEGFGTTVKLYLPRAPGAAPAKEISLPDCPGGQGQTVLLIEDNCDMRAAMAQTIEHLGYQVLDVTDARGAWELIDRGQTFDLLLSDVVLPGGTSGPALAREVRKLLPDLPVLFMSGYPADVVTRQSGLERDQQILKKPFGRDELAEALRAKLDT